jgi:hypothetical protein
MFDLTGQSLLVEVAGDGGDVGFGMAVVLFREIGSGMVGGTFKPHEIPFASTSRSSLAFSIGPPAKAIWTI